MKVLVCGGRNFDDREFVRIVLDRIHKETPITGIVHGAAPGADTLAGWWATINEVPNLDYPAPWRTHGKAAGPIRNQMMLDAEKPDMVVAFPGGRGTADMVDRARRAGIPTDFADRDRNAGVEALRASVRRTTSSAAQVKS